MHTAFAGSSTVYRAWLETIKHTHERQLTVRVLRLDHDTLESSIDGADVLDGQVTIDTSRDVSRVLNISLFDSTRSIGWEPDSPSSLPTHLSRMLQVIDRRLVPGVGWLGCPVFTGPVSDFDREGATVHIVAEGKERLALGSMGRHLTFGSKRKVTSVIREILVATGESPSRIHLPELEATLPEKLNIARTDQPWLVVRKLARSVNRVIFYDGRGHVQMRRAPKLPGLVVDADSLLSHVRIDREPLEIRNRWIVLGPKPKGDKKRVHADVRLPKKHPLSGESLGRNGQPRWLIHEEQRGQLKTNARALEIARDMRDEQQNATAQVVFECLPFPQVEEYDLVRAVDPVTGTATARIQQATIPLVAGAMSVGSIKRVALVKKGRRRRAGNGDGVRPGGGGGL